MESISLVNFNVIYHLLITALDPPDRIYVALSHCIVLKDSNPDDIYFSHFYGFFGTTDYILIANKFALLSCTI